MDIELGVPGQIMPPADKALQFAQRAEADGFDAVWWPDHLMNWFPDSIWTEDISPLTKYQRVHTHFDPLVMMSAIGAQLERTRVGVVVTDLLRRNPAMAANALLTLDHVTRGKAILGLGSGERLNVEPYGIPFDKPVGRFEEALHAMRLLMDSDGPVDYEGTHIRLKDAVLHLPPFGDRQPPIWTAAHGPRMLSITGRYADGWLPTKMTPEEYGESLEQIEAAAEEAGRDSSDFTPGMLGYVLVGPDEEAVERMTHHPLVRFLCVLLPSQVYRKLGFTPPLEGSGSGFHDFIPTRVPREESERIVAAIDPTVVRYYAFCGTPESIVDQLRPYHANGLRHLILWNITAFGDPELARWSFDGLRQIKDLLRAA
jgi:phthiodiolone/phenolphthiodiolone dimycocerosates ketoreductase